MIPSFRYLSLAALLLGACATAPVGPGVAALPGTGKTLEQFRTDDSECQRYATAQSAQVPGAAVSKSSYELQRRYDFSYIQCMYSKGHKVPVSGAYTSVPPGYTSPPDNPAPPSQ
ncbi:MAG TPA: glycine zipper family protein [Burkholderiales bacterium]|nr:glycine zipper family protein [Burkholderiales bacterium]